MGNAYKSAKRIISNKIDEGSTKPTKQRMDDSYRRKKLYIICQHWRQSMKLNGLISSLIDIIVEYAYTKYDPKYHPNNDNDHLYKLLLVGPESSGKSCILLKYADDTYSDTYIATIGVDFKIRTIDYENKTFMIQLWDTAGQKRFREIVQNYYRGVAGILIVFDITNRESFDSLSARFILDVSNHANFNSVLILIGTKCDLEKDRKVSVEEAKQFAKSSGYVEYIEVSAKNGTNIQYCVKQMVKYIREKGRCKFDENRPFLYPCTD